MVAPYRHTADLPATPTVVHDWQPLHPVPVH